MSSEGLLIHTMLKMPICKYKQVICGYCVCVRARAWLCERARTCGDSLLLSMLSGNYYVKNVNFLRNFRFS